MSPSSENVLDLYRRKPDFFPRACFGFLEVRLYSGELSISSRFVGRSQALSGRPSRGALFLTSLLSLAFLSLLVYVKKHFIIKVRPDPGVFSSNYIIYASPFGKDENSGNNPSSPKTFLSAAAATRPGSVVCLLPGTYNLDYSFVPPQSGTASAWIVYKSCGEGVVNLVWTAGAIGQPMFRFGNGTFPSGPSYLEFRGLPLDGRGNALDGFFCLGGHHLRFVDNSVINTGGSGIASVQCDYLTADHNVIVHNGFVPPFTKIQGYSWTSGISFNSNQWFDRYPGFHNIISNNIVTGEVDQSSKHTDGNGIILDLSNGTYDYSSANTPPALAVNNVVYGNGGRCLESYTVTNFWFVNNTCYKNVLDLPDKAVASITINNSHDGYVINNLVATSALHPCYSEENKAEEVHYFANLCFGSSNLLRHSDSASPQFIFGDPLFGRPPDVPPNIAVEQVNRELPLSARLPRRETDLLCAPVVPLSLKESTLRLCPDCVKNSSPT